MIVQSNHLFDLSDHHAWSLRTAEMPFINGNHEADFHCFLMLAEENSKDPNNFRILDELHFVLVTDRGNLFGAKQEAGEEPVRPGIPFLGSNAYTNPKRNLEELATVTYVRGAPCQILQIWNNAFSSALEIVSLGRQFDVGDCRAGAKAAIHSLGYTFQTFGEVAMQRGLNSDLTEKITRRLPDSRQTVPQLLENYQLLRQRLHTPRPVAPTETNKIA